MTEGFVINGGEEYYCSKLCLNKHYTDDEWDDMHGNGDTESYWTKWEGEVSKYG
jgi:hypothetical protein